MTAGIEPVPIVGAETLYGIDGAFVTTMPLVAARLANAPNDTLATSSYFIIAPRAVRKNNSYQIVCFSVRDRRATIDPRGHRILS